MSPEAELNALKKLESNKVCANCDAYSKFGHGNICEKARTFVCSNCKSAHQAFSMRVKSVTMSNWSQEEVDALRDENGGGNDAARRIWLGRWREEAMRKPSEGDHVDVYKRFIDQVYNARAFYDDEAAAAPPPPPSSSRANAPGSSSGRRARVGREQSPPAQTAKPVVHNAAAVNLLDFSSPTATSAPTFNAFASAPLSNASSSGDEWGAFAGGSGVHTTSTMAPAANGLSPDFAAFASASAPPPSPAPMTMSSSASSTSFDPFALSASAPVPSASPQMPMSAFDPFASSGSSSNSNSNSNSAAFPAFPAFQPPTATPLQAAPPSGSFSMTNTSSSANFNAFDALTSSTPGMQRAMPQQMPPNGMGMGMMPGSNMGGMHAMNGMHNMHSMNGMNNMNGMNSMNSMSGMHGMQGMNGRSGQPPVMLGGNASMSISSYMAPTTTASSHGGTGYGRSASASSARDPFAGLGLPGQ